MLIYNRGCDKRRGHPGSNRGPLDLQSNALPLSYIPAWWQCTQFHIYLLARCCIPRSEHTGFMGLPVEYRYGQVYVVKFPILSYSLITITKPSTNNKQYELWILFQHLIWKSLDVALGYTEWLLTFHLSNTESTSYS